MTFKCLFDRDPGTGNLYFEFFVNGESYGGDGRVWPGTGSEPPTSGGTQDPERSPVPDYENSNNTKYKTIDFDGCTNYVEIVAYASHTQTASGPNTYYTTMGRVDIVAVKSTTISNSEPDDRISLDFITSESKWVLKHRDLIATKIGVDQYSPRGTYVFDGGPCEDQPIFIL
jgi:hypothetical protein